MSAPAAAVVTRPLRLRLTLAFVAVAGVTCGLLGAGTYVGVRHHRLGQLVDVAERQARLVRLQASPDLTLSDFEALVVEFRERGGFETVVATSTSTYSSRPGLGLEDVPDSMQEGLEPGATRSAIVQYDGRSYVVAGGPRQDGSMEVYVFLDRSEVLDGLSDLAAALVIGWTAAMVLAASFGHAVARRTLRPVRQAADAAQAIAGGLLTTRMEHDRRDEFGLLAKSFNQMVEALEEKIDELSRAADRERQFTNDVAHELRTPLAGLAASAALLEPELDLLQPALRRPAQLLVGEVQRLQTLVLELLELARLDAGAEAVQLEVLSARQVLDAVVAPWRAMARITTSLEGDHHLQGDHARLRRIFDNLLVNAMEHGRGVIEIEVGADGQEVRFDVLDRGPGIPADHLDRVFDRFFKSDRSRSGGGSGLGLAIARESARLQGGRVSASNRPGGGAHFTVWLPAAPAPDDGAVGPHDEGGDRVEAPSPSRG